MFKVGDRVIGNDSDEIICGKIGVVRKVGNDLLIEFDDQLIRDGMVIGHDGMDSKLKYGHGWYANFDEVDLIPKTYHDGFDEIDRPQHYADKEIEVIDYIKDTLTFDQYEGYVIGNVIKYISRYRNKGGVKDLQKAHYYLMEAICELKERDCE